MILDTKNIIHFKNQINPLIDYYIECTDEESAENETADRYLDNPEKRLLGMAQKTDGNSDETSHKKQYSEYLKLKYAYFVLKEKNKSIDEIYTLLGIHKSQQKLFNELFEYFDEIREKTSIAFLLRNNQLSNWANNFWYNNFEEFKQWSNLILKKQNMIEASDMGKHIKSKFNSMNTTKINTIKKRTTLFFNELFSKKIYIKKEYIKGFIKIIEEEMKAGLVDYLIVEDENDNRIIRFYVVSDNDMNEKEEKQPEIRDEEKYKVGEGITGSILIPNKYVPFLHVGTNDLKIDSRQSEKHESVYSKLYGRDTNNFWLFPLFNENDQLYAAFRVINKKEDDKKPYWSYDERAELCMVAVWFQSFWKTMENMLDSLQYYFSVTGENKSAAKLIINKFGIQEIISEDKLGVILAHLTSVVHRKIESSSMKVLFVISKAEYVGDLKSFASYPIQIGKQYYDKEAINIDALENLSLTYKVVNPITAFYLFSSDGKFQGVRQLTDEHYVNGIKFLKEKMRGREDFIAFYAEGKKRCIRFLYNSDLLADYYLSESSGKWQLRFVNEFNDILRSTCIKNTICKSVCEIIFDLSYRRIGTILIFSDNDFRQEISHSWYRNQEEMSIQGIGPVIRDMAAIDGAIVISNDGHIKLLGLTLDSSVTKLNVEFNNLISESQKGARHTAAAIYSKEHKNDCVIVISENKGISILYNGKALIWNDKKIVE